MNGFRITVTIYEMSKSPSSSAPEMCSLMLTTWTLKLICANCIKNLLKFFSNIKDRSRSRPVSDSEPIRWFCIETRGTKYIFTKIAIEQNWLYDPKPCTKMQICMEYQYIRLCTPTLAYDDALPWWPAPIQMNRRALEQRENHPINRTHMWRPWNLLPSFPYNVLSYIPPQSVWKQVAMGHHLSTF